MMSRVIALVLVIAACGGDSSQTPDAAPMDAPTMCPPQTAMPLPPGQHKLYLATEGVALTMGNCDDSEANCTSLIISSQTVPPFYENEPSRQSSISAIVGYVQRALAPYSIDVVLERPTSGYYWMIVMGGSSQSLIGNNTLSVARGLCDASDINGVSLVFDVGSNTPIFYATSILSNFGAMLGMSVTAKADDCMCRSGAVCNSTSGLLCSFGVDVPVNPDVHACGRTTQNEPMMLAAALGCR